MHGDIGLNLSRFSEKDVPYSNACSNFTVFIVVDNIEDVYARAVENGWTPDSAPKNEFWAGRTFTMRDMNGFKLMFVQMVEFVTLEEVRRRQQDKLRNSKADVFTRAFASGENTQLQ